eukprot:scaffold333078_cov46-Prasinocladus_malaysianus.AAC.1
MDMLSGTVSTATKTRMMESVVNDLQKLMPLEPADAFRALLGPVNADSISHKNFDDNRFKILELNRMMRAELQANHLPTTGSTEELARRMVENKLTTVYFFRRLRHENLLTDHQSLRSVILRTLDGNANSEQEYYDSQETKMVKLVVDNVFQQLQGHHHFVDAHTQEELDNTDGSDDGSTDDNDGNSIEEEEAQDSQPQAMLGQLAGVLPPARRGLGAGLELVVERMRKLSTLTSMGFPIYQAMECLEATGWNSDATVGMLLNM